MSGESVLSVLAVETSSGHGSIALARGGPQGIEMLEQTGISAEWTGTALHLEIAALLTRHHLTMSELDGYAVTIGPGSFTAVRVGAAAVKGLAEVYRKPVVAVSTLELIARVAAEVDESSAENAEIWVPILDARRAQVFGGVYKRVGQKAETPRSAAQFELIGQETVGSLSDLLQRSLSVSPITPRFCSPETSLWTEAMAEAGIPASALVAVPGCMAGTLARLGWETLRNGGGVDAALVDANYIRASDAELFRKA